MNIDAPFLRNLEELTAPWLESVLGTGSVADFETEEIGTGQMSQNHRVLLGYERRDDAGPASVVLKLASADPNSRGTGVALGAYEREIRFYRELAPRLGGPLPVCHAALLDPDEGWFTLVLEDVAPAVQGDQIAGCDLGQAQLAMRELARLHAPVFADSELGATPWLNQEMPLNQALLTQLLPAFLERYGDRVSAEHRAVCERFVASLDGWIADRRPPLGLVHGDFRLDNLLFGEAKSPRPFTVVDWQTVGWGPAMTDACYFLGGGLPLELRRAHETDLVREYHRALRSHGVESLSWEDCWADYRRQCFLGILMAVAPAMLVERTGRGGDVHDDAGPPRPAGARPRRPRSAAAAGQRSPGAPAPDCPTRAVTPPGPSSCGTRAGTSTRSPRTGQPRISSAARPLPQPRRLLAHRLHLRSAAPDYRGDRLRGPAARRRGTGRGRARAPVRAELRGRPGALHRVGSGRPGRPMTTPPGSCAGRPAGR